MGNGKNSFVQGVDGNSAHKAVGLSTVTVHFPLSPCSTNK